MECSNCSNGYCSRRSLIRHIQTSHPEEIESVRCYQNVKTHECHSCGATFSTRRSLIRHCKHYHSDLISTASKEKTWDCYECVKKYTNKFSWYKHKRLCHPNSSEFAERVVKKIFECSSCGKKYSFKRSLRRHLQSTHPQEMASKIDKPIVCNICGKRYTRNTGFTLHMKRVHTGEPLEKLSLGRVVGYDCPICQIPFDKKPMILQHFIDVHQVKMVSEYMEFDTRAAFDEWRTRVELESRNNFSIRSSQACGNHHSVLYSCSRSGFHQSRSSGRRKMKVKGSRKINGYCPAEIRLKVALDEHCQVQFTGTHVGHANELAHMRLTDRDRESIVAALDANVSIPQIMRKFATASTTAERNRLNVVRHCDVRNVLHKRERELLNSGHNRRENLENQNLAPEPDESKDETLSSQSWVNANGNSLLYAKCAGAADPAEPSLEAGDFAFVIMTATQRAKLAERGHDLVCVRRLRKPLKYRFYVTVLLVRLPQGRHYACAFLLSNREDAIVYRLLLRYVCREVPPLLPHFLIGPVAEPFYEAWVKETGHVPECRLHCLRDMLHTLKRRIRWQVKSAVTQKQLQSLLDQLLFATNSDKFFGLVDVLKVRLETESRLRRFFEEKFESCVEHWAYCCVGVDANVILENFYSRFDILLAISRPKDGSGGVGEFDVQERDAALVSLLVRIHDMIERQEHKQLLIEEWGETETCLDKMRYRHKKTVYDFENVLADESGTQWMVMSATKDEDADGNPIYRVYVVQKMAKDCVDCKLVCWPCGACVHDYKCSCPDAEQRGNMCSHVHLVCQFRMRRPLDGGQQAGMLVEEVIVE